jgi:hypothetical protein
MDPSPSAHVAGVRLGQIKRGFFPVSEPHIDDAAYYSQTPERATSPWGRPELF